MRTNPLCRFARCEIGPRVPLSGEMPNLGRTRGKESRDRGCNIAINAVKIRRQLLDLRISEFAVEARNSCLNLRDRGFELSAALLVGTKHRHGQVANVARNL